MSAVQADEGVLYNNMGECFLGTNTEPFNTNQSFNVTAYLSIVAEHVHLFITTIYPSSNGYFKPENDPCHKAQSSQTGSLNITVILVSSADFRAQYFGDVLEQEICSLNVQLRKLQ